MRTRRTDFSHVPSCGLTSADVDRVYGAQFVREELEKDGVLKPVYRQKNFKLFASRDVQNAWDHFCKKHADK
jgi:hypothetical protein